MNKAQKQKVREELESIGFGNQARIVGAKRVELYSYLIQKLEDQERELVGRIDDLKIEHPTRDHDSYGEGYDTGYNDALNEVISSITKEGGA